MALALVTGISVSLSLSLSLFLHFLNGELKMAIKIKDANVADATDPSIPGAFLVPEEIQRTLFGTHLDHWSGDWLTGLSPPREMIFWQLFF